MFRKIFRILLIVILIAGSVFFYFGPQYFDKSMNKVTLKVDHPKKVDWYDSIPFIADLHCDELLWDRDLLKRHDYGHVDLPRMQEANMAFEVFTVVSKTPRNMNYDRNGSNTDNVALLSFVQLRPVNTWFNLVPRALNQCAALHKNAEESKGAFRIITSQADMQRFVEDRKKDRHLCSGMLGLEGAHCLDGKLENLDKFFAAGVRYIGLTHFFDNEWAGSAHGLKKEGLTPDGRKLVQKMDSLHIIIDLAHASSKTIDDVMAMTSGPLLVSHTGVQALCNNQRNLSDAHLIEIGKRNGLVGIGLWETAVCGTDATATAKTIRYVADKIGVDKVAMGSDFDGAIGAHFDVTGFPLIVDALLKEGFSRPEIEMIMGGNVRDFMLRNLPAR